MRNRAILANSKQTQIGVQPSLILPRVTTGETRTSESSWVILCALDGNSSRFPTMTIFPSSTHWCCAHKLLLTHTRHAQKSKVSESCQINEMEGKPHKNKKRRHLSVHKKSFLVPCCYSSFMQIFTETFVFVNGKSSCKDAMHYSHSSS